MQTKKTAPGKPARQMTDMKNTIYALNTGILSDERLFRRYYAQADPERRGKTDRFRFERDKRLSLGADILLRHGLMKLGIADFRLGYGSNGKPFITGRDDIFFNISHSGDYAVCAFSDKPVGADIEKHHGFDEDLIRFVFRESETAHLSYFSADRDTACTDLWTVKESLMKLLGTGLSLEPKDIQIIYGVSLKAQAAGYECERLNFTRYDDIDGYSLTVCSEYDSFSAGVELFTDGEQ